MEYTTTINGLQTTIGKGSNFMSKAAPNSSQNERFDPKQLRTTFKEDFIKHIPIKSYKIIHQCLHPTYHANGTANRPSQSNKKSGQARTDFVLILEQQFLGRKESSQYTTVVNAQNYETSNYAVSFYNKRLQDQLNQQQIFDENNNDEEGDQMYEYQKVVDLVDKSQLEDEREEMKVGAPQKNNIYSINPSSSKGPSLLLNEGPIRKQTRFAIDESFQEESSGNSDDSENSFDSYDPDIYTTNLDDNSFKPKKQGVGGIIRKAQAPLRLFKDKMEFQHLTVEATKITLAPDQLQGKGKNQAAQMKMIDENQQRDKELLRPLPLKKVMKKGVPEKQSIFKLSLWSCTGKEGDSQQNNQLISSIRITAPKEKVRVVHNKVYFSSDGKYIYLLLANELDQKIVELLVFDSVTLEESREFYFDFSNITILESQLFKEPQLVHLKLVNVPSSYMLYLVDRTSFILLFSQSEYQRIDPLIEQHYRVSSQVLSTKDNKNYLVDQLVFGFDETEERIIVVTKELDSALNTIACFLCNFQKLINQISQNRRLSLNEEVVHLSRIESSVLQELPSSFSIEQCMTQKDQGLIIRIHNDVMQFKQEIAQDMECVLAYIPRSSVTKAKEAKALFLSSKEIIPCQNGSLQKELQFIILIEQNYFLVPLKDIIGSLNQGNQVGDFAAFLSGNGGKNSFLIRDKEQKFQNLNLVDFQSVSANYCAYIELATYLAFDVPKVSRLIKASTRSNTITNEDQFIVKYDIVHLNPYVIVVEDATVLHIYSRLQPMLSYRLVLNQQLMKHIQMVQGSIRVQKKFYYRHQVFAFLTLGDATKRDQTKGLVRANCLILPRFSEINENLGSQRPCQKTIKIIKLPFNFDQSKFNKQDIIQVFLDKQHSKTNRKAVGAEGNISEKYATSDSKLSIVIQQRNRIVVFGMTNRMADQTIAGQSKFFVVKTNSSVPIELCPFQIQTNQNGRDTSKAIGTLFYVHAVDSQNQQAINMFFNHSTSGARRSTAGRNSKINQGAQRLLPVLDFATGTSETLIKMCSISSKDVLLFSDTMVAKHYKFSEKQKKLKLVDDNALVDQAQKAYSRSEDKGNDIVLTQEAIYIDNEFYLYLPKQHSKREQLAAFEKVREKRIFGKVIDTDNLCMGPLWSADRSSILYMYRNKDQEMLESMPSGVSFVNEKNHDSSRFSSSPFILQRQKLLTESDNNDESVFSQDEDSFVEYQDFRLAIVPQFTERSRQLFHQDDFVKEEVEFSTFINEQNDVLIKLKQDEVQQRSCPHPQFLIFDRIGSQYRVDIDERVVEAGILNVKAPTQYNLTQIQRIAGQNSNNMYDNPNQDGVSQLALLYVNSSTNKMCVCCLKKSEQESQVYTISLLSSIMPRLASSTSSEQIPYFNKYQIDRLGRVCQLTVLINSENKFIVDFYINGIWNEQISTAMRQVVREYTSQENQSHDDKLMELIQLRQGQLLKSMINNGERETTYMESSDSEIYQMNMPGSGASNDDSKNIQKFDFLLIEEPVGYTKTSEEQTEFPRYIIMKIDLSIFFAKIKNDEDHDKDMLQFQKIKLKLEEGCITQILPTQAPDRFQFLYISQQPLQSYVFTWDLLNDWEQNLTQVKVTAKQPLTQVSRGISLRENYIIPSCEDAYFDLRYQFSKNFMSGQKAFGENAKILSSNFKEELFKRDFAKYLQFYQYFSSCHFGEYKIAFRESELLGLSQSQLGTIQLTYSYVTAQYASYLISQFKEIERSTSEDDTMHLRPILEYVRMQFPNESNILHYFPVNELFLKFYLREVKLLVSEVEDQEALRYAYYSLFSNGNPQKSGKRPLTMALKGNAPKSLEIILDLLALDENQDYMRYVSNYLESLLKMNSRVFLKFFESNCSRKLLRVTASPKQPQFFLKVQSQYLNSNQINQTTGNSDIYYCCYFKKKRQNSKKNQYQLITEYTKTEVENDIKEVSHSEKLLNIDDALSDDDNSDLRASEDQLMKQKTEDVLKAIASSIFTRKKNKKRVEAFVNYTSYDFESIFKGKKSKRLLRFIGFQNFNSNILELRPIQAYLDSQWQFLKYRYYRIVFLYLIAIILQFIYQEVVFHQRKDFNKVGKLQDFLSWKAFSFYIVYSLQLIIGSYLFVFEMRRFVQSKLKSILFFAIYNLICILIQLLDLPMSILANQDSSNTSIYSESEVLFLGADVALFVVGFFCFLLKIMQLNLFSFYLNRIAQVLWDQINLFLIVAFIQFVFCYCYKLLSDLSSFVRDDKRLDKSFDLILPQNGTANNQTQRDDFFSVGWIVKGLRYYHEVPFSSLLRYTEIDRDVISENIFLYPFLMIIAFLTVFIVGFNLFLLLFLTSSVVESYKRVSVGESKQKYLALAQILHQNSIIFPRKKKFKDLRYVIKVQVEQVGDRGESSRDQELKQWDDLVTMMTQSVKQSGQQDLQRIEQNFKTLKNRIQQLSVVQEAQDNAQGEIKQLIQNLQQQIKSISDDARAAALDPSQIGGASASSNGTISSQKSFKDEGKKEERKKDKGYKPLMQADPHYDHGL